MFKLSKIKIYISFLFYKFVNGLLFSISIYAFARDSSVLNLLPVIILQEFYFSFFYTAKKNQSIECEKSFPIYYYIISSVFVFALFYIYSRGLLSNEIYLIVTFNLVVFSIYAWQAPQNEKNNVTKWVSIENKVSLLSVLLIFLILSFGQINQLNVDNVILLRLGMVYFFMNCCHFFVIQKKIITSSGFKKYFDGVDIIILLFCVKIFYFDLSLNSDDFDGYGVKLYFVFYDILAAIFGLYIRRVIAINNANFDSINNALLISNIILVLFFIVSLFFVENGTNLYGAVVSCVVFVSLAVNYNYFNFKGFDSSIALKVIYVIVLGFLYITKNSNYFIIFVIVNLSYSFVLYYRRRFYD